MSETEFEKIFRENFAPLCNLAVTVVKNPDTAKDIVQQVFVNFWQKKDKLTIHTAIRPYLYKAVVNTGINYIKKENRFSPLDSYKEKAGSEYQGASEEKEKNTEECIHAAINILPPVCQKVFRLSRFTDMTNKEIADELKISVKAVEKHITKALKILRTELKPVIMAKNFIFLFIFILVEVGFYYIVMSVYK